MNIIIITRPDFFDGETALVNRLFRLGMQRLHLRKPGASSDQLSSWIRQIDSDFYHRIVLHDHHSLTHTLHLGGIHLNSRNPDIPHWAKQSDITISRSCHSLDELILYKPQCDYLFLSPIFDSISKEGYGAAFSASTLISAHQQGIIDHKVFALGGISSQNLSQIRSFGFGGAAILGDLWMAESPECQLQQYLLLSSKF